MKSEQHVTPEERKAILKKMFHTLRQSPMFSHYSIEHIRDSAIKSEQLTYNRSLSKQEYFQAMHAKLLKIEKSYVMNSEEILREISKKEKGGAPKRPERGPFPREYEEREALSEPLGSFRMRYPEPKQNKKEEAVLFERAPEDFPGEDIETLPSGRTYSIPIPPHRASLDLEEHEGAKSRITKGADLFPNHFPASKASITREGVFLGEGALSASNPGITPILSMDHSSSLTHLSSYPRARAPAKVELLEETNSSSPPLSNNFYLEDHPDSPQRLWKDIKPLAKPEAREEPEKAAPMQNFLLNSKLGSSLHRTGTAGSTNTITKMNATKTQAPPKTGKSPAKGEKDKEEDLSAGAEAKKRVSSLFPPEETPSQHLKNEIASLWKEVNQINSVMETHKNLFPKWESQRKILYDLESTLQMKAKVLGAPDIESLQGILQQMKKQAIVLTAEIKQLDGVSFKQRLLSISAALSQKEEENPSYLFYSAELPEELFPREVEVADSSAC